MSMTVTEIIEDKLLKKIQASKGDMSGIIVLDIEGPEGGQWTVDCDNALIEKKDTENPTVRIKISDSDFLNLVDGSLSAVLAMFTGKLKVEGDMSVASKLASVIR